MSCTHPKLANAAVAHDLLFLIACWCNVVFHMSQSAEEVSEEYSCVSTYVSAQLDSLSE